MKRFDGRLSWASVSALIGLLSPWLPGRGHAEARIDLQRVEPGKAGLQLRLPASWERAEFPGADATYADPDRPYWRFQVSTSVLSLPEEEIDVPLGDLVSGIASLPGNTGFSEVRREGPHRLLVEYEHHAPGVAPTRNWQLFDREGTAMRTSLFTLSIHEAHWKSEETLDLVRLLRRELWEAVYRKPIFVDAVRPPVRMRERKLSDVDDARSRLRRRAATTYLSPEQIEEIGGDVWATTVTFARAVQSALEPHGTKPDDGATLVFVTSLYVGWLQGSQAPNVPEASFEKDLIRAATRELTAAVTEAVVEFHGETRDGYLDLVARLALAHRRAEIDSQNFEELFASSLETLASIGVDVQLGRNAEGTEREPWIAAIRAVIDAYLESADRMDARLANRPPTH